MACVLSKIDFVHCKRYLDGQGFLKKY